ncbi:MAG: hypothetical protein ACHQET_06110 [Chitinophagales bacterium]
MSFTITSSGKGFSPTFSAKRISPLSKFLRWSEEQDQKHHIGWVGISVTLMAAVFFPLTMTLVLLNGASFGLIVAAMGSLALVVISNLAALPTKYTIPLFFLGILIDLAIVVASFI